MESDHINRHAKNGLFQCRTGNRIKKRLGLGEFFRSLQLLFVELHWGIWQKISTAKDHCKLFSQALRAAFKAICFAATSTEIPQTPQTNRSIMFHPIITDSLPHLDVQIEPPKVLMQLMTISSCRSFVAWKYRKMFVAQVQCDDFSQALRQAEWPWVSVRTRKTRTVMNYSHIQ